MKQILEQLWQEYGEDYFIEALSDFLIEKQNQTLEGTSCWTLFHVPIEFDPDIVIEAAYSCRKIHSAQQLTQGSQLTNSGVQTTNTDVLL